MAIYDGSMRKRKLPVFFVVVIVDI